MANPETQTPAPAAEVPAERSYVKAYTDIVRLSELPDELLVTYLRIKSYDWGKGWYGTLDALAKGRCSTRTVQRHLDQLKELGFLRLDKRPGMKTRYVCLDPMFGPPPEASLTHDTGVMGEPETHDTGVMSGPMTHDTHVMGPKATHDANVMGPMTPMSAHEVDPHVAPDLGGGGAAPHQNERSVDNSPAAGLSARPGGPTVDRESTTHAGVALDSRFFRRRVEQMIEKEAPELWGRWEALSEDRRATWLAAAQDKAAVECRAPEAERRFHAGFIKTVLCQALLAGVAPSLSKPAADKEGSDHGRAAARRSVTRNGGGDAVNSYKRRT